MIDTIVSRHGRIDVVVNNAGGSPYVPTSDATPTFNEKIVALNLSGAYTVAYYANSVMQNQDRAFILWVAFAVGEGAYWIGSSPNTVVRSISRGEFWS